MAFTISIISLLSFTPSAITDQIMKSADKKLADLREKAAESSNLGLIDISGSDFEKFITRGPRPYFCLVILTALSSGNCQPCEQLNPSIQTLSALVEDQRHKISRDADLYADS